MSTMYRIVTYNKDSFGPNVNSAGYRQRLIFGLLKLT